MDDPLSAKTAPAESQEAAGHPDKHASRSLKRLLGKMSRKSLAALGAVLTAVVASIVAAIVMGWFSGGHTATLSHTSSIVFQPWTFAHKVSSDLHVVSKVTGSCWTGSISAPRQDAYRCATRHIILDPCFAGPEAANNQVVCTYPSPKSVTIMQLTTPLPTFSAPSSLLSPWLLILADGKYCYEESGGTQTIGGMRLNYGCGNGRDFLYGNIDKANRIWTIFQQRNGAPNMTQAQITTAYY
jgi:hypothetical protein